MRRLAHLLLWLAVATLFLIVEFSTLPTSLSEWLLLVGLGLPLWAFAEWLGRRTLGHPWFDRLSSPARIALGVPVLLAAFAALVGADSLAQRWW